MAPGGRVGITLRQTIICHTLKDEPKTAHAIGEEITAMFRKLPKYKTCTWVGGERSPIESRLTLGEDEEQHCRNREAIVTQDICEACRHYCLRELAPTSTFKNIDVLLRHGILSMKKTKDGHKQYTLNQGCFNGIVVFKTVDNNLFITICPNILCKLPVVGTRRDINDEKCIYYKYIYTKKPLIEVKL